jgi:hypothetical protein
MAHSSMKAQKVAQVYKVTNIPPKIIPDFLKFIKRHQYLLTHGPLRDVVENADDGCVHMFVQIPDRDTEVEIFMKRFECIPWSGDKNKPRLREISLSEEKAQRGKFRAVVILDSIIHQIGIDTKTVAEAENLIYYYHCPGQPVQIFNDKGKPQIPVGKKK